MSKKEEADDDVGEKKTGKKKLIIIIAVVVLLIGAGVGVYLSGLLTGGGEEKPAEEKTEEHSSDAKKDEKKEDKEEKKEEEGGHGGGDKKEKGGAKTAKGIATPGPNGVLYYELPSFLVNLNSGEKRTSFLKMTVTLELASAEDQVKIDEVMPRITDSFNTYLRELRSPDIAGSAGLHRLREELLLRINEISQPAKVNDILFKEIIVQ